MAQYKTELNQASRVSKNRLLGFVELVINQLVIELVIIMVLYQININHTSLSLLYPQYAITTTREYELTTFNQYKPILRI